MKKNLKMLVERPKYERPRCLASMNRMELVEACGMKVDLKHKRSAHLSGLWKPAVRERISLPLGGADLSAFSFLTFAIFAESATGMLLEVFLDASEAGDLSRGFRAEIKTESKCWNHFSLPLSRLESVGGEVGKQSISYLHLTYKKGRRLQNSALYLDSIYLYEGEAPKLYELVPDLSRAVVFSECGTYSLVRGKRVLNSPFGNATPMRDESGKLWVPFTPVVAGSVRSAEADSKAKTLTFTYRKKRYLFAADRPWVMVDGDREMLKFAPIEQNGALLVPADYAATFFGRKFSLAKDGIFALSNRKNWFLKAGKNFCRALMAATCFPPVNADALTEEILRRFAGSNRPRVLFSKEELLELRKAAKGREAPALELLVKLLAEVESSASSSIKKKCLASTLAYLVTGKKKARETIKEYLSELSPDTSDLAEFGRDTYVLSLAYDVLRPVLTEGEKADLERKLLRACLRPGLAYYAGELPTAATGSFASRSASAGLTVASLAMMDAYPETARRLLSLSLGQLQIECLDPNDKQPGKTDLLLAVKALIVASDEDCGCLSVPQIKEAYDFLFAEGKTTDAFLRIIQATLTPKAK